MNKLEGIIQSGSRILNNFLVLFEQLISGCKQQGENGDLLKSHYGVFVNLKKEVKWGFFFMSAKCKI